MRKSTRRLVEPAIYRLNLGEHGRAESSWGWHLAEDVWEAITNIRESRGEEPITVRAFTTASRISPGKSYIAIETLDYSGTPSGPVQVLNPVDDRHSWHGWFEDALNEGYYIPAKLGRQLVEAAKLPNRPQSTRRG